MTITVAMLTEFIILATVFSGIRALMATGFALIFGVSKIFYMAYGALYMIGAYTTYVALEHLNLLPIIVLPLSMLIPLIIALLSFKYLIFPRRKEELNVVIITFAFAVVLEQIIRLTLAPRTRTVSSYFPGSTTILGVTIGNQRIMVLAISFAILACLWIFLARTRTGKAIRAVSENEELAKSLGIDAMRISLFVAAIAAMLAGASGFLLAPIFPIEPGMGWSVLIEALTIVVLGSVGSLPGVIIGAFIVSYTEVLVAFTVTTVAAKIGTAIVLIVILLFKPEGLFGVKMT